MSRLFFPAGFIILLLNGCQAVDSDFNSPHSKPPVGAVIQLNQPLIFQLGRSRSFVQYGQPVDFNEINEHDPWCQFYRYEPASALQTVRTVEPDSFSILSSTQKIEWLTIPSLSIPSIKKIPDPMTLSTLMKIKSEIQPEIVEFKCSVFDFPYRYNFVSVNEIRQALGDIVTLKIK